MSGPVLSRALMLEARQAVADGAGGFVESWVGLGTLWAEVLPGAGRDVAGLEAVLTSVPYRITVRGAPQGAPSRPVAGQRFRDGGRIFAILAVTERDGGGFYLTCFAREEGAA